MDTACIHKVITVLGIEGLKVRNVLEVVGIDLTAFKCIVGCHIVSELNDLKLVSLSCQIINDKVEKDRMGIGCGTYLNDVGCCGSFLAPAAKTAVSAKSTTVRTAKNFFMM